MNILILSAFKEEQNYYHKIYKINELKKINFVDVSVCRYENINIYLATTGMGTINASLVLATLASETQFDFVYFSGTSGGIHPDLRIGDVVIATETFDADIFSIHEAVKGTPFEEALINPNKKEKTPKFFTTAVSNLTCINQSQKNFKVYTGRIATSNHFPSPHSLFEQIKLLSAMAIDMESASVYQFSWSTSVPSLVIRGISNLLDQKGEDKNVTQSDVSSSDHAAMIVHECIQKNLHQPNFKICS